jgi:hypothetical protein
MFQVLVLQNVSKVHTHIVLQGALEVSLEYHDINRNMVNVN